MKIRRLFTPEEDAMILSWSDLPALAQQLHRHRLSVYYRFRRLTDPEFKERTDQAKHSRDVEKQDTTEDRAELAFTPWTSCEDAYLLENEGVSAHVLARYLKRSYYSVRHRRRILHGTAQPKRQLSTNASRS